MLILGLILGEERFQGSLFLSRFPNPAWWLPNNINSPLVPLQLDAVSIYSSFPSVLCTQTQPIKQCIIAPICSYSVLFLIVVSCPEYPFMVEMQDINQLNNNKFFSIALHAASASLKSVLR